MIGLRLCRIYHRNFTKQNIPARGRDEFNGYFLNISEGTLRWFFQSVRVLKNQVREDRPLVLTATTLVATVQTLITSAAAHHDMTADITGRRIALHIL